MTTIDISEKLTIATRRCPHCNVVAVGTILQNDATNDFVCANCDPDNFSIAAEAQKEAYLAGDVRYTC